MYYCATPCLKLPPDELARCIVASCHVMSCRSYHWSMLDGLLMMVFHVGSAYAGCCTTAPVPCRTIPHRTVSPSRMRVRHVQHIAFSRTLVRRHYWKRVQLHMASFHAWHGHQQRAGWFCLERRAPVRVACDCVWLGTNMSVFGWMRSCSVCVLRDVRVSRVLRCHPGATRILNTCLTLFRVFADAGGR